MNNKAIARPDILTVSGRYFNYVTGNNDIVRNDVIRPLSRICRFGGQLRDDVPFYSVAQHSVLVSMIVPPAFAFWGLFHDAAEAFTGDMMRPLKNELPDFRRIEKKVESEVFPALGLFGSMPICIKQADLILLATEQRDLMHPHDDEWASIAGIEPLPFAIQPLMPQDAFDLFMHRLSVIEAADLVRGNRVGMHAE